MKRHIIAAAAFAVFLIQARAGAGQRDQRAESPPQPVALPTIAVTLPKDVALVDAVAGSMAALSEKVTACVSGGGNIEKCRCSDPQDLARLRKDYKALIAKRPEWKDGLLSYQRVNEAGRNISGTLVMTNLRRELDALKCR